MDREFDNHETTAGRGMGFRTYTGRLVYPFDLRPEDVNILDIAHALSNQCRFAGHTREFYSVAQHSLIVSYACSKPNQLWGLLHDAPEAYLVDLPRPIKYHITMGGYRLLETRIMAVIVSRFGLDPASEPPEVQEIDHRLLLNEKIYLHHAPSKTEVEPLPISNARLEPMTPQDAEDMFIRQFYSLGGRVEND